MLLESAARGSNKSAIFLWGRYGGVLLAAAILLGGGYWAYDHWVSTPRERELSRVSQVYVNQRAAAVEHQLVQLKRQLQDFARQGSVRQAVQESDRGVLEAAESDLRNKLPHLEAVSLISEGDPYRARHTKSMRFTELDMVNRAGKGETVLPEASRANGNWRISLVEPVPSSAGEQPAAVPGMVLATFRANELFRDIVTKGAGEGSLQLLQHYPGQQPRMLLEAGQGDVGQHWESQVANSYFLLRFTPAASFAAQTQTLSAATMALIAAAVVLAIALACGLVLLMYRPALLSLRRTGAGGEADDEPNSDTLEQMALSEEDQELLGIRAMVERAQEEEPLNVDETLLAEDVPDEIFRSYDIRGLAKSQLTPGNVVLIGQAIGSQARAAGEDTLIVGRDGRNHSPEISEQLIEGILATGCRVVNIGMVPTPMMYFACELLEETRSGVMVTASHNPPEYNGFKVVIAGNTLKDDDIQELRARIVDRNFSKGRGKEEFRDISAQYSDRILSDVALAGELSVVVDAGNGAAGEIAPRLLTELGCTVTPLFCEVDGDFPNRPPDPSVAENLHHLIDKVGETGADLGIALDGDGDRVGVVTASGRVVAADRLLMLLAKDIVSRNPGADILFDVKCSRQLNSVISSYGGRPLMWKAGHSHMKAKMQETGALLAGELSGHIFIKERWYGFDDGLYAAARIMEIMSLREQDLDSILESFPAVPATPEIRIDVEEAQKFSLIRRLIEEGDFGEGRITTIDGLRVDYPNAWGLVRPSNTSAELTLRFEGETSEALEQVTSRFKQELRKIDSQLNFNV